MLLMVPVQFTPPCCALVISAMVNTNLNLLLSDSHQYIVVNVFENIVLSSSLRWH